MKLIIVLIITLAVLLIASLLLGKQKFNSFTKKNLDQLLTASTISIDPESKAFYQESLLTEKEVSTLPPIVQKWLQNTGAIGYQKIKTTRLKQTGLMRLKPEQENWISSQSEQTINLQKPGFIWTVQLQMAGLPFYGLDKFIQGQGTMWISLAGLIPVVQAPPHPKINQSALIRYLGETIWSPTAVASPWIQWTQIDDTTAQATMTVNDVSGSALFYFNESGELQKFVAQRYKETHDDEPTEWRADVKSHREFQGLKIPTSFKATWVLKEGPFTWYKFEITDVEYLF